MSLLMLAIEYMLLHTVFESIRGSDEQSPNQESLSDDDPINYEQLLPVYNLSNKWKPLSNERIFMISYMINNK